MINFHNQVPSIYTKASRDFQYLSWLINIVLNSVKHNVDDIYSLPNVGLNSRLSELLAMTLGFKVKRNYDQKQLIALVTILPSLLRYKGTLTAVEMAAEALITASGAFGSTDYQLMDSQLRIIIPEDSTIDITLFLDLLDYILPAGMTCRIIRENRAERNLDTIYVKHRDSFYADLVEDLTWTTEGFSTGLAGLFEVKTDAVNDITSNFRNTDGDEYVLNAGLLSNTVIPILPTSKEVIKDTSIALLSTEIDENGEVYYKELHSADGDGSSKKLFAEIRAKEA